MTTRYQQKIEYRSDRFNPVVVAESERTRVLVVCLEPGQHIPVHRPSVDLTLVVLEGDGVVTAGEREEPVGPGAIAFVPAGEARGLRAVTRLVALHTVTPPPSEADHAEVVARLRQGEQR